MNQYDLHSLEALIDELSGVSLDSNDEQPTTDVKILYNGPLGTLSIPLTYEASCQLGSGTKWCTASEKSRSHYDNYSQQGPLYVWRDRDGSKYQFHFESCQFMDSSDQPIPPKKIAMFRSQHPVLSKLFHKVEHEVILKNKNLTVDYIHTVIGGPWKEAEDTFFNSAHFSYVYAKHVIYERFSKGEKAIASNPEYSIQYRDFISNL